MVSVLASWAATQYPEFAGALATAIGSGAAMFLWSPIDAAVTSRRRTSQYNELLADPDALTSVLEITDIRLEDILSSMYQTYLARISHR